MRHDGSSDLMRDRRVHAREARTGITVRRVKRARGAGHRNHPPHCVGTARDRPRRPYHRSRRDVELVAMNVQMDAPGGGDLVRAGTSANREDR